MFGELSISLLLCFVFLPYFRSVHGCMGMDVWVNVFTMPFLCADSAPWRKISRAWPAMSAITTSWGSTSPSHQESAWGAVEAIQKGLLWRLLEGALLSWNVALCVEHIYKCFFVSTVLGEKSFNVEQASPAYAKLPGRRPPPHWRGRANKGIMFGELSFLFVPDYLGVFLVHFHKCFLLELS